MIGVREKYFITIMTTVLVVSAASGIMHVFRDPEPLSEIRVGFLYEGDVSANYVRNFVSAERMLNSEFGDNITIVTRNNVRLSRVSEAMEELIAEECDLIFSTSYTFEDTVRQQAAINPDVEFCQASGDNANITPVMSNYHTFMGEIYQARYVTGVIAGMKLRELIDSGRIREDEALVGFVAAFPIPQITSSFTAFFLGVLSEVPQARMLVSYTRTWSNFSREEHVAADLIARGCVIISQHTDTYGPAMACEKTPADRKVYHVGYNHVMSDLAPTSSLIGCRINWTPYIIEATRAVMRRLPIEDEVRGRVHGRTDMSGGFAEGWLQMLELNDTIAPQGSAETVAELVQAFSDGRIDVFRGPYTATSRRDPEDTYDLRQGFRENEDSSSPTFDYVLDNITEIN